MTDTGKVIRKVRQSTKKKFKKRMKLMKYQYAIGEIDIEDIDRVYPGFKGHLSRGHTYRLVNNVLKDFVLVRHDKEDIYENM